MEDEDCGYCKRWLYPGNLKRCPALRSLQSATLIMPSLNVDEIAFILTFPALRSLKLRNVFLSRVYDFVETGDKSSSLERLTLHGCLIYIEPFCGLLGACVRLRHLIVTLVEVFTKWKVSSKIWKDPVPSKASMTFTTFRPFRSTAWTCAFAAPTTPRNTISLSSINPAAVPLHHPSTDSSA